MPTLPGARSRPAPGGVVPPNISINDSLSALASQEGNVQARATMIMGDMVSKFGESITNLAVKNAETRKATEIQQSINSSLGQIAQANELEDLATAHTAANSILDEQLKSYPFNSAGLRHRFTPQMGNLNAQAIARRNQLAVRDMKTAVEESIEAGIAAGHVGAIDAFAQTVAGFSDIRGEAQTEALITEGAKAIAFGQMMNLLMQDPDFAARMVSVLSNPELSAEDPRASLLNETQRNQALSAARSMRSFHEEERWLKEYGAVYAQLETMVDQGFVSAETTPLLAEKFGETSNLSEMLAIVDSHGPAHMSLPYGLVQQTTGMLPDKVYVSLRNRVEEKSVANAEFLKLRENALRWWRSDNGWGVHQPLNDAETDKVLEFIYFNDFDFRDRYNILSGPALATWTTNNATRLPLPKIIRDELEMSLLGGDEVNIAKAFTVLRAARDLPTWDQQYGGDLSEDAKEAFLYMDSRTKDASGNQLSQQTAQQLANAWLTYRDSGKETGVPARRFHQTIASQGGEEAFAAEFEDAVQGMSGGALNAIRRKWTWFRGLTAGIRMFGRDTVLGPLRVPGEIPPEYQGEWEKTWVAEREKVDFWANFLEEIGSSIEWAALSPLTLLIPWLRGEAAPEDAGQWTAQIRDHRDKFFDNLAMKPGATRFERPSPFEIATSGYEFDPITGEQPYMPPEAYPDYITFLRREFDLAGGDKNQMPFYKEKAAELWRNTYGQTWMMTPDGEMIWTKDAPEDVWHKTGGSFGQSAAIEMRIDLADKILMDSGMRIDPSLVSFVPGIVAFDKDGNKWYQVMFGTPGPNGIIEWRAVQDKEDNRLMYMANFNHSLEYQKREKSGAGIFYKGLGQFKLGYRTLEAATRGPLEQTMRPPEPPSMANPQTPIIRAVQDTLRTQAGNMSTFMPLRWGEEQAAAIKHLLSDDVTIEELNEALNNAGIPYTSDDIYMIHQAIQMGRYREGDVQPGSIDPRELIQSVVNPEQSAVPTPPAAPEMIGESRHRFDAMLTKAALEQNLQPELVKAVAIVESNLDPNAGSSAGARGLMQLMPATAKAMGVDAILDPQQNVRGGAKYLRQMLDRYNGNLELALAAYNAGPTAVDKYGGIPPFPETQNYVKKVMAALDKLTGSG